MNYLALRDYLLIAQAVTGVTAETLAHLPRMALAESALAEPAAGFGSHERFPTISEKAAALCWHLARNHPLPDGNKRAAYLSMREFVERNGCRWLPPVPEDGERVVNDVAAGRLSVEELADWVRTRILEA